LPVGTPVVLHISDRGSDGEVAGKVVAVSESQELSHAGMRVRFADPAAATLFGTPEAAAPEAEPESPPPAPRAAAPAPVVAAAAVPVAIVAPQPSGHRRIVVDASSERPAEAAAPEAAAGDGDEGVDHSGATGTESGRIPAPDPGAFSGGGGKRGRRQRRR
jgi:hypothetical protein